MGDPGTRSDDEATYGPGGTSFVDNVLGYITGTVGNGNSNGNGGNGGNSGNGNGGNGGNGGNSGNGNGNGGNGGNGGNSGNGNAYMMMNFNKSQQEVYMPMPQRQNDLYIGTSSMERTYRLHRL